MILIDNSQILVSSVLMQVNDDKEISKDLVRHIALSSYLTVKRKFGREYGEIVICNDTKDYWRKDYFPNYKANRKKARAESDRDWSRIFGIVNEIRDELKAVIPYRWLAVDRCEADDLIATLAKRHTHIEKQILIISSDGDFEQLQILNGMMGREYIEQWSPMKKEFLKSENPVQALTELVIRGDAGDGVPNVLSEEDCLISDGKRQKPMTKKRLDEIIAAAKEAGLKGEDYSKINTRYGQNNTVLNLFQIPPEWSDKIMEEFNKTATRKTGPLLDYMVKNRLTQHLENITEF